ELHGLVDRHFERDDSAGDFVEPGEDGGRILDLVGRRRSGAEKREAQGKENAARLKGLHRLRVFRKMFRSATGGGRAPASSQAKRSNPFIGRSHSSGLLRFARNDGAIK